MKRGTTKCLGGLAVGAAIGVLGCSRPPPAISHYVRAEPWTAAHAAWLQSNCQLQRPVASPEPGVEELSVPWETYWQLLEVDVSSSVPSSAALAYACPKPPPWPRTDGEHVQQLYNYAHQGSLDLTKCDAEGRAANYESEFDFGSDPPPPRPTVTILEPGQGPAPGPDSYVRIQLRSLEVGVSDDGKKGPAHAPIPFTYVPLERVTHMTCVPDLKDALLKLRAGGRARLTFAAGGAPSREIALLEVGDESLFRRYLGLSR